MTARQPNLNKTLSCLATKTFGIHETIQFDPHSPPAGRWREDITLTHYGRCYTLNSTGLANSSLSVKFRPKQKHSVFLHDPDLFLHSGNPVAVPRAVLHTNNISGVLNVFIQAAQHRRYQKLGHLANIDKAFLYSCVISTLHSNSSFSNKNLICQAGPGWTAVRGEC